MTLIPEFTNPPRLNSRALAIRDRPAGGDCLSEGEKDVRGDAHDGQKKVRASVSEHVRARNAASPTQEDDKGHFLLLLLLL